MRFSYPDASGTQLPPSVFGKRRFSCPDASRSLLGGFGSGWKFATEEEWQQWGRRWGAFEGFEVAIAVLRGLRRDE
ncbi:hypothetical protein AAEJ74_07850 [Limnospira fusiformis PMC 851.14]|uniref:Uncharacterized protein n=1 Tax=Limnospira fusiformis PMC 851.14 TaxID=2219512 RepID=A0ABU9EI50_LIMFS